MYGLQDDHYDSTDYLSETNVSMSAYEYLSSSYSSDGSSPARIIGGDEAPLYRFPTIARMRIQDRFSHSRVCRGEKCGSCASTILNANWIITAAHCCYGTSTDTDTIREVNTINFQVGGHFDASCTTTGICKHYPGVHTDKIGVIVNATRIIPHPNYRNHSLPHFKQDKFGYDYCLVEVTDIDFGSINHDGTIRADAVTLPQTHVPFSIGVRNEKNQKVARNCEIAGWGKTGSHQGAKQSSALMSTRVRVMSHKFCQSRRHPTYKTINSEYGFCAGAKSHDSCHGDSGGPLYCASNVTDGAGKRNVDVLYGIVSRGPNGGCGRPKQPGIYSKVNSIIPWIRTYTTGILH